MTRVEASIIAMNASAAKVYLESGRPHEGLLVINDLLEYLRPHVDQRSADAVGPVIGRCIDLRMCEGLLS
jgi:hypothetical protein